MSSFILKVAFLWLFVAQLIQAESRVSLAVPAFAKECVYHRIDHDDDSLTVAYQVLYGGDFELDFEILSPSGKSIIKQTNEKYADFVLRTFGLGEYSFCFINPYNQLKKVEFIITKKDQNEEEQISSGNKDAIVVEHSISEIDRNLGKIDRILAYLRAREWRNMSTVASTESRIFYLSLAVIIVSVSVSIGQATLVQFMFSGRQKNYV